MPKSKRRPPHRKEKKQRIATATEASTTAISQTRVPLGQPRAVRTQTIAALGEARYPYVASELKRIGILAGIVVVILIVLAIVLPLFS